MSRQSQAQAQSDAFFMAEGFLAASLVLDDDLDIDLFDDEDDFEADLIADDTLELFEFSALNWIAIAEQMTGGDTRGPYNLIPKPQQHVKYQLGCFLIRYGMVGSDTLGTAQKLSLGFGSVFNYCYRVRRAIRELRPQYLGWPTAERKHIIATSIEDVSGFPKCLGAGDGSLIFFLERPLQQGYHFMTRKKQFNIQATCDNKKRFTSFEIG
ncbi:hypothetical protein DFH08DRAFT_1084032, partial [Mycena albidolilacea]